MPRRCTPYFEHYLTRRRHVDRADLATGEAEETYVDPAKQRGAKKGGEARAATLNPEKRQRIAKDAAAKRWEQ